MGIKMQLLETFLLILGTSYSLAVCKHTDDLNEDTEIAKPIRQPRNYDFQFGHSTNLDKLLQSLMVFENGKKVPLEENEWKEKQENMPAYCNHPFWQHRRKCRDYKLITRR